MNSPQEQCHSGFLGYDCRYPAPECARESTESRTMAARVHSCDGGVCATCAVTLTLGSTWVAPHELALNDVALRGVVVATTTWSDAVQQNCRSPDDMQRSRGRCPFGWVQCSARRCSVRCSTLYPGSLLPAACPCCAMDLFGKQCCCVYNVTAHQPSRRGYRSSLLPGLVRSALSRNACKSWMFFLRVGVRMSCHA